MPGEWVEKDVIYREADIVSLHVPLTAQTKNMVRREQLLGMKPDAMIVNTARGGIINEADLAEVPAMPVTSVAQLSMCFAKNRTTANCRRSSVAFLTSHMGSMSVDCRTGWRSRRRKRGDTLSGRRTYQGVVPRRNIRCSGGALTWQSVRDRWLGFLGSHVADALSAAGHQVCIYDRRPPRG